MKNFYIRLTILIIYALLAGSLTARSASPDMDTLGVKIYFNWDSFILDDILHDNGVRFEEFAARLNALRWDDRCRIESIRIISGASTDGSTIYNKQLSEKRGKYLKDRLEQYFPLEDYDFKLEPLGVDWALLDRLVSASDMPYRDEVLYVLRNTPEWISRDGKIVDGRKLQLKKLHGGKAWNRMLKNFFPELRYARAEVVYEIGKASEAPIAVIPQGVDTTAVKPCPPPDTATAAIPPPDTAITAIPPPDTLAAVSFPAQPSPKKPFYMSVRNNMLYDVALVPNLGIEFYLGKGWSLAGEWMYAWWKTDKHHYYWRIYGGDLGIRRWFGRSAKEKPLTGHHAGVYGQMSTYDFELGGRGYLAPRWSWGAGLEYGYALPVSRRLNIDFVIGAGYFEGKYYEYIPLHNRYVWQATKQRHYIGVTKAEISLVWLIGRGNVNKKKGEKR